uniref:Oxysterol-binding protein n=2 Tax=Caenorhabditis japonica TaxID=281687 RepID=A0A8R1HN36_CAEJA
MEGPLSKWTNMVHGWQYRWFKIENDTLLYYTSRDKMLKGQQRGQIRLNGAVVGIDGENNSLFTITVEGKTFHMQGRDLRERNQWVRILESSIRASSGYTKTNGSVGISPSQHFKQKTEEANDFLKTLVDKVKELEQLKSGERAHDEKKTIDSLIAATNNLTNNVKHAIIYLQMAQARLDPNMKTEKLIFVHPALDESIADMCITKKRAQQSSESSSTTTDFTQTTASGTKQPISGIQHLDHLKPQRAESYASSDEEEFYDADEELIDLDKFENEKGNPGTGDSLQRNDAAMMSSDEDGFDFGDSHEDFDEIYNNAEEHDIGNVQQEHGSVLMHLLSQVSVGMDLTKVTLPTFILERRSLLEMYADFFAHPDLFIATNGIDSAEKRMIAVVRYYLNAFYAARKSGVAKKPYNAILGETFRCRYTVPNSKLSGNTTEAGPWPGSDEKQLTFIAEQVSHHPPISAFYAEMPSEGISFNAHIYTKSSFLGLSIGVASIGEGILTLHNYGDEQYTITFPSGYGRSIMSTPWFEFGGKVKVACEKTGYYADIEFLTKPFFGGKPHRIQGSVYREGTRKPILTIRGEWNGVMYAKPVNGDEYTFVDVKSKPEVKKECVAVMQQGERESRRLWRHVTAALLRNRIQTATTSKRFIEQRQRNEAKERLENGEKWTPLLFETTDNEGEWVYKEKLGVRETL